MTCPFAGRQTARFDYAKGEKMNRRIVTFASVGILCVTLIGLTSANAKPKAHKKVTYHKTATASPTSDAQAISDSSWNPDPSLLDKLAPATQIDSFSLRLPTGFTEAHKAEKPIGNGTMKQYIYVGQKRQDGEASIIFVHTLLGIPMNTASGTQSMLDKMLDNVEATTTMGKPELVMSKRAYRQGSDLPLVREYFKYTDGEGKDKVTMHGFHYGGVTDMGAVLVTGLDAEPFNKVSLPLSEASALTLHK